MGTVLDACAVIAMAHDEPGADVVESALRSGGVHIHAINLAEVWYDSFRRSDDNGLKADLLISKLIKLGVNVSVALDGELWRDAAKAKAVLKRISLADCFVIALARRLGAQILTADRKEFDTEAVKQLCSPIFIR